MKKDDKADPQYIRLGDGTLIDTATGKKIIDTEINRAFSDQPEKSLLVPSRKKPSFNEGKRRYIDDLPVSAPQSRAVALISSYYIFGLAVPDIAYILRTDEATIQAVLDSDAYTKFVDAMLQNIREHDQDQIRKKINKAAQGAVDKIVALVDTKKPEVALKAAQDILDRNASDNGLASSRAGPSTLTIRIIDDTDNPADKIKVDFDA